ncbi:DUF2378 family protein [Nannocystaceae bacterium ST9]
MEPLEFAAPRLDHSIDVDAILARLPAHAATKGLAISAALDRLRARPDLAEWTDERVWARVGAGHPRPAALQAVPWSTYLRVSVFVARLLDPECTCRGLREIGRAVPSAFGETLVGRMLFGTLGRNFARVLLMAPNAWRICDNFGAVEAEPLSARQVRFHFVDYPTEIVETAYVGTLEGVCTWLEVEAEFAIGCAGARRTVIDLTWRSPR